MALRRPNNAIAGAAMPLFGSEVPLQPLQWHFAVRCTALQALRSTSTL